MRSFHGGRPVVGVLGAVALLMAVSLTLGLTGCKANTDMADTDMTNIDVAKSEMVKKSGEPFKVKEIKGDKRTVFIRLNAQGSCFVTDARGSSTVLVPEGGWITWENQTKSDAHLSFRPDQPLFGVDEAVVPANDSLRLKIAKGVHKAEYEYGIRCGSNTQLGPKIIVIPPPPPGGGE